MPGYDPKPASKDAAKNIQTWLSGVQAQVRSTPLHVHVSRLSRGVTWRMSWLSWVQAQVPSALLHVYVWPVCHVEQLLHELLARCVCARACG